MPETLLYIEHAGGLALYVTVPAEGRQQDRAIGGIIGVGKILIAKETADNVPARHKMTAKLADRVALDNRGRWPGYG